MLVLVLHIALFPSEKNIITQIDKVLGKYNGENKRKRLVMLLLMMTMVYMTITNLKVRLIHQWKLPKADLAIPPEARCLKITEKVSFNIASEASYVYILSGQKII